MRNKVKDIPDFCLTSLRRAGIILITRYKQSLWFGMGVDRRSGDLSDFGGMKNRKDTDIFETAIREFHEESLEVFGILKKDDLWNCFSVYDKESLIIFVPLKTSPKKSISDFKDRVKHKDEMSGVIWVKQHALIKMIKDNHKRKIYSKVKEIISNEI